MKAKNPKKPQAQCVPAWADAPGAACICDRCKRPLRVADRRREDSAPFRLAKEPKGECPDCVMTAFLYNTYPLNLQLDQTGPQLLLNPMIRDAFLMSGILDKCDLTIDEINWQRVVDNWNLPVEIAKKDPRNPYRMGDENRRKEAMREAGLDDDNLSLSMFGGRQ